MDNDYVTLDIDLGLLHSGQKGKDINHMVNDYVILDIDLGLLHNG